MPSCSYHLRIY